MDEVCDSHAPLIVTRQNARPVVLISQDEYDRMAETLHLMRSPRNALRLLQAMENSKAGRLIERELIEIDDGPDTGTETDVDADERA